MSNVSKKSKSLLRSTFVVSFMTITSRLTGYLRDLVCAHVFGAGGVFDAFTVAFRIPNFLRRLFAEGAFSQAFVPVLSEYKQTRSEEEIQLFLNRMAGSLAIVLFLVTAVAVLITPWLVLLFAPGFLHDPTRLGLTETMLRITFPYLFFISLTAYISGILNTYGKFSIPAFTPNLFNFAMIAAAIIMAPYFDKPIIALAWGVFLGGLAQLLFQLPFLCKLNLFPHPKIFWQDEGVKRVMKLMLPAVFGVSVGQLSVLIDTFFASFLRQGSLSWLYFSDRVTSVPIGVFGVAIVTVILPHLSRKYAANSMEEFSATVDWAIRFILLIGLPATIGIALLADPILTTLFQHGKFDAFSVVMARRSLLGFALGIPAFMLVKVFASAFYSRQNIKTPVKIAVFATVCNFVLDAILVFPLAHAGLALATSLTSFVNAGLLFYLLRRDKFYEPGKGWKLFWLRMLFANGVMSLFLLFVSYGFETWIAWSSFARAFHLGILCIGAFIIYFGCLFITGVRLKDFRFNA